MLAQTVQYVILLQSSLVHLPRQPVQTIQPIL